MRKVAFLLLVVMSSFNNPLAGQSTNGQIAGIVRDSSKTRIPGVEISLVNTETKAILRTVSNERGEFRFQVPEGYYEIAARLPGFRTAKVSEFRLKGSETIQMEPIDLDVDAFPGFPLHPPEAVSPRWIPLGQ